MVCRLPARAWLARPLPRLRRFRGRAWHGRVPVGHVLLRWQGTARYEGASRLERCTHVSDLFVVPRYWSRGIGTRLMDTLESLAARQGYIQVGLSVAVDNVRARSLYA